MRSAGRVVYKASMARFTPPAGIVLFYLALSFAIA
jgi:hypothetical protein